MHTFTLPTMTCGHCEKAVTAAVRGVDATAEVSVDLAAHRVTITSPQPREAFAAALQDAGYEPAAA